MTILLRDLRHSLRQLRQNPVFFSIIVLTLGLGIGANTAIFSLVDWLVLRSLPIRNPDEMHFLVFTGSSGANQDQFSYAEFTAIEKQTGDIFSGITPFIFGGLEGAQNAQNGLTVDGATRPVQTVYVGSNFFPLLGIRPAIGRFLLSAAAEAGRADPVVILSYNYWQTRFSGDPSIVGKAGFINGHAITIVGIAPKGFLGPTPLVEAQAYLPLGMYSIETGVAADFLADAKIRSLVAFARVKPGASPARVQSELAVVGERMLHQYPRSGALGELRARPLRPPGLMGGLADNPLPRLAALFLILAALVLGLAGVNIANLFLVRTFGRQREMAIRTALGAAKSRIMRQLLTESLVVAALGCVVGILLGIATDQVLRSVPLQTELPFALDFDFDWRAFLYAFGAAGISAILVVIAPIFRVWRGDVREILQESGRSSTGGRQHLRSVLVTAEVAGCLTLLVISGLFVRSLRGLQSAELGFNPERVLNLTLDPNEIGYSEAQGRALYAAILERARALPGVQSVSLASAVPLSDSIPGNDLVIPGFAVSLSQPAPHAMYDAISTGYLDTMGMTLLRGRDFTFADTPESAPVALINQAMADRYWPGQDPLGQSFATQSEPQQHATIVGVVGNVRMGQLFDPYDPVYYRPVAQSYQAVETLQIRSPRGSEELVSEVRGIVQTLAPAVPIYGVRTMTEALHGGNGLLFFEIGASLAAGLGGLGLVLAVVGVYGLMSYTVSQRTQELGIRMALGAQRRDILRAVGRQGFIVVAVGLALGLLAACGVGRLAAAFLVGPRPNDPATYLGVSLLLAMVALAATYIPARRATRLNPIHALRRE